MFVKVPGTVSPSGSVMDVPARSAAPSVRVSPKPSSPVSAMGVHWRPVSEAGTSFAYAHQLY
ncbi:hypothetical protein VSR01_25495 [Actinacidiphila sp. DG2A-62]|uniref:hypothetical protein n=1 Tax=Actinacidiphila sp. DG2A-62 TaxID=3108821 RepID=UPI002DB6CB0B|nr:hypothetical protein [Actinacidiphila sp. DG2A-62]MEC3996679.1 hypothetical protein [Actinacidiphila sp. DG2A-62]